MFDDDDDTPSPNYKREHALEKFLNIEPTEIEKVEYEAKPLKRVDSYDDKDFEIETQMEEIFNESMEGYQNLQAVIDSIEPKYRARMAEVALQYLKTGLDAANSKSKQKVDKDKMTLREMLERNKGSGKGATNVIVTADRNEFLKELRKMANPIDGEVIDQEEDDNESS